MFKKLSLLSLIIFILGLSLISAQERDASKPISKGVINGSAITLTKPEYPPAARAVKASGAVNVEVIIDESGNVISAAAVSGHPLLRSASETAARTSTFKPTMLQGQPVKVTGVIVYNFVGPTETPEIPASNQEWLNLGSVIGLSESKSNAYVALPEGFSEEENQMKSATKLSANERFAQNENTLASIKARLNPSDLWYFEFGLTKGKIMNNFASDAELLANLNKFKELADRNIEGIQPFYMNRAAELAKFANKQTLTKEEKDAIYSFLR